MLQCMPQCVVLMNGAFQCEFPAHMLLSTALAAFAMKNYIVNNILPSYQQYLSFRPALPINPLNALALATTTCYCTNGHCRTLLLFLCILNRRSGLERS